MQKPCHNCPFLKDSLLSRTLPNERKKQIVETITNDKPFTCHKTTRLDVADRTICIGSAILLEKTQGAMPNYAYRIHAGFGKLNLQALDLNAPVFDSFEDFIEANDSWTSTVICTDTFSF